MTLQPGSCLSSRALGRFRVALTSQVVPLYVVFLVTTLLWFVLSHLNADRGILNALGVVSQVVFLLALFAPQFGGRYLPLVRRKCRVLTFCALASVIVVQMVVLLAMSAIADSDSVLVAVVPGEIATLFLFMGFHATLKLVE